MHQTIVVIILLLIFGLALGSFINAYVWRVYKQSSGKKKEDGYSILFGRSMCPKCHKRLRTIDLIPAVSWILLKGRCHFCNKKISPQYPLVELLTPLLFIFSYIYWPLSFHGVGLVQFILWLVILVNLIALAIYDLKWLTLPSRMLYPLLILVLGQIVIVLAFNHDYSSLVGDGLGFLIGGGMFYILFQVSGGKWIGGGDIRLGALLGLALGSGLYAVYMIFLSSLIGTLISLPLIIGGKVGRKSMIPYGPYLIIATIIIKLFGQSFNNWLNIKGLNL